jgi:hypothetical protein
MLDSLYILPSLSIATTAHFTDERLEIREVGYFP